VFDSLYINFAVYFWTCLVDLRWPKQSCHLCARCILLLFNWETTDLRGNTTCSWQLCKGQ